MSRNEILEEFTSPQNIENQKRYSILMIGEAIKGIENNMNLNLDNPHSKLYKELRDILAMAKISINEGKSPDRVTNSAIESLKERAEAINKEIA